MKSEILDPEYVGEAIIRRRRKAGLTQKRLAEEAGIHPSLMSRYESGETRIGRTNLKKICNVLHCSPEELLSDAWQISESGGASTESASGVESPAVFPEAELEKAYDESFTDHKRLYLKTCRVLFEALRGNQPSAGGLQRPSRRNGRKARA
ncbi:MAG TPA: helix-turn-helix transcriptional regulator [Thermoanaerobaculia bacterium]|jgi:transcriptional regulator with XRE-family HTH domain